MKTQKQLEPELNRIITMCEMGMTYKKMAQMLDCSYTVIREFVALHQITRKARKARMVHSSIARECKSNMDNNLKLVLGLA